MASTSPPWMARSVSSASASRASSSAMRLERRDGAGRRVIRSPRLRPQVEADQHPLLAGEVADEAPEGGRKHLDERGRRDDLLVGGEPRALVHVDHLQVVVALEVLLADAL